MSALLLDTHAVIWLGLGKLNAEVRGQIEHAAQNERVLISPVSAFEISYLQRIGRLGFVTSARDFWRELLSYSGVQQTSISVELTLQAGELASDIRDPWDRVLIATAILYNATLVTRDRQILAFAEESKLFAALGC